VKESDAVNDWVEAVTVFNSVPCVLNDRILKVTEVPKLDTLSKWATTCHNILIVMTYVNGISTDWCLSSDGAAHLISSDVPEAYLSVSASWVDHVIVVSVKFAGGDFVGVGGFQHLIANLLNKSHSFLIVDFDVGLRTSDTEFPKLVGAVDSVVWIFFIQVDVLNRICQSFVPTNNWTVKAGAEKLLAICHALATRMPWEARDGSVHIIVLNLIPDLTINGRDNLKRAIKEAHTG